MKSSDRVRRTLWSLAFTICLYAVPAVTSAHHSHPLFFDWCRSVTIEGRVTRIEWKNPHSLIDLQTDTGTTYHVEWMPAQALARRYGGAPPAALIAGVRVVVVAHPLRDAAAIHASFPDWKGGAVANTLDPVQIQRADGSFTWMLQSSGEPPNCNAR